MRAVIVGAGGVGAVIGARLATAGNDVAFVARGLTLRALREHGLRVTQPTGELFLPKPVVTDAPGELPPADVLFLCTKLYDLEEAARACAPIVREDTLVVPIQNGVEADEIVRGCLQRGRILVGLVYTTSSSEALGRVRQTSAIFRMVFGARRGGRLPADEALEAACRAAGLDATLADDIVARLWSKLVFLGSVSALTCLGRMRIGELRSSPGARALLVDAMREVIAVANAQGFAQADDLIEDSLKLLDSLPPDSTSSMHADLMAEHQLEVEWLSGAVVRGGHEHGVATPIHRTALECLLPHAGGATRTSAAAGPENAGYRLSLQQADQQLDVIHGYLTRSYWSPEIARTLVETAVRNSLVVGAFDASGKQVGFARLVTDHATFGYLADVFVLEEHCRRGLATAMVRSLMELPEVAGMRALLLATRDAHGVYARLGWSPLADPSRWMEV